MKTRILVTGASGFVGGSFCRQFAGRADLEIRGLARSPSDLPGYVRADLTEPLRLDWRPDVVIHAAARASPWGTREEFQRQNVLATEHVVAFCRAQGVRKLVHVSSSSVFYRQEDQLGLTEESPIGPEFVNEYARTKAESEEVVRRFAGASAILRPRAVFGPGDTVLFPRILRAARAGRMAAITRPGPPVVGDLIYIDALCDYLLQAALDPGVTGDFNLTNDEPVEILALLSDLLARLGLPPIRRRISYRTALFAASLIERFHRMFRPGVEPPITRFGVGVLAYSKTFDVRKARRVLGPPSVGLHEGLERFVTWQKAQWVAESRP
ncbi:MAG: NAD-dependent epimerase/dehydratase family protein [Verrucomicrobia bacterium]|nr:NAD-dependent epimerase/dehydratase family protein [Verrucomicrobiota bacterium]